MRLGFVGLGSMGLPMARNLLRAGHQVAVYNRTAGKVDEVVAEGAHHAATPSEACEGDAVFSMLSDDAAVEEVVTGRHGILAAAKKDVLHVSMSTIGVAASRHLNQLHRHEGQTYIAAPVFGRPEAAAAAKLTIVAAGPAQFIEHCRPAFDAMGQKLFNAGEEPEQANLIKLCGNFMLSSMLETMGEAFAVLRKSGVDPNLFLEIVNGNLFRSPVYENYGKLVIGEKYEPAGFKLRLGLKDVKLALAAAEDTTAAMPLASLIRDKFLSGVARGYGDLDWSALAKVAAIDAGLE